jgi:hypothetical protein
MEETAQRIKSGYKRKGGRKVMGVMGKGKEI